MHRLYYAITLLHCLFSLTTKGQTTNSPGAASLAQGGIITTDKSSYSALSNPSGTANVTSPELAFSYTCPYQLQALSQRSVLAVYPTSLGNFGALFLQSGYSVSIKNRYAVHFSRKFGSQVTAAFQFNVLSHSIKQTDVYTGFFSVVGMQFSPSKSVTFGFVTHNPEQSKITYSSKTAQMPSVYALGLNWHPTKTCNLTTEIEKYQTQLPVYKFGIEVHPQNILKIRGGYRSEFVELSFGVGLTWKIIQLDIGLSHHQQLGTTSAASVLFSWQ